MAGERVSPLEQVSAGEELLCQALLRMRSLAELADAYGTTWAPDPRVLHGQLVQVEHLAIACQRIVRAELLELPPSEVL